MKKEKLENKVATLFEKADRYTRVYGHESPKTIKAWAQYDKYAAQLEDWAAFEHLFGRPGGSWRTFVWFARAAHFSELKR